MKYNVLRKFKAPDSSGPFEIGSDFKTDNKDLAKSLIDAKLIEEQKKKSDDKSKDKYASKSNKEGSGEKKKSDDQSKDKEAI